MTIYEKSEIRKGMYMELDAPWGTPVQKVRRTAPPVEPPTRPPPPQPIRYGAPLPNPPDFKAVSARLDAARAHLEKITKDFRNARRA